MKRVLITGASGFIGRQSVAGLLSRGYEVHAADLKSSAEDLPGVRWHLADLLAPEAASRLISEVRPSHLLHMAWITTPGEYWTSPKNLRWVIASLELLQSFADQGGKRVVMAGSCAEYDWKYGYCSELHTPLMPATLYGACKNSLHSMLDAFAAQAGLTAAWGRIFLLYGPYEHPNRLVSSVIRSLLKREPANCSHGKQVRDFLHVEDVGDAFAALLDSDVSGALNIASGQPATLRDVVTRIASKLDAGDLLRLGAVPVSEHEPPLLVADVGRLSNELSWIPKYDLDRGLDQTIAWWRSQLLENAHGATS